jgi:hypothetical protein
VSETPLENSFHKLLGRQPTDKEIQSLYRTRDALGLKNNDALWLIIMSQEFQRGEYEDLSNKIETSVNKVLDKSKDAASAIAVAATEDAKFELAKAVGIAANKVAQDVATTKKFRWAAICFIVSLLALSIDGGAAGWGGYTTGLAKGYQMAQDQKAAAAWANTQEGQIAYRFAQTGDLKTFSQCSGFGWKSLKGVCYAFPGPAGADGQTWVQTWKIPPSSG